MCFSPQRRALFRHLNFQKWSEPLVLCTFWLRNVLRAATACTFSTSQLPKVVRQWCVLYMLTLKCASRHKGVHFFRHLNFQKCSEQQVLCTFWLGNVLRATTACNFSSLIWPAASAPAALASLLFDPPEPQIIGKTQCLATFLPFPASASAFFWLFLFSDLLSSTLSLLSASSLLCFSSVHIVGSLTSKLPSKLPSITFFQLRIVCLSFPWKKLEQGMAQDSRCSRPVAQIELGSCTTKGWPWIGTCQNRSHVRRIHFFLHALFSLPVVS